MSGNPALERPWDIYARLLFPLRQGYPLWRPAPHVDPVHGPEEVRIGSVGRIEEGSFRVLFNALEEHDQAVNRRGVPLGFVPLQLPKHTILGPENILENSLLVSTTMEEIGRSKENFEETITFQCSDTSGALLYTSPSTAIWHYIQSKRRVVKYIVENYESWAAYAESAADGPMLDSHVPGQLALVCGTVHASNYMLAAFEGNDIGEVSLSHQVEDNATCTLSDAFSHGSPSFRTSRGPSWIYAQRDPGAAGSKTSVAAQGNHCLFIHYFKVTQRLTDPGSQGDIEADPIDKVKRFDPVDVLLTYILKYSYANIAIASTWDLIQLFKDGPFPEDLGAALEYMELQIDVDEDGVGTIPVSFVYRDVDQTIVLSAKEEGDWLELQQKPIVYTPDPNEHMRTVTCTGRPTKRKWVGDDSNRSEDTIVIIWDMENQSVVCKSEAGVDTVCQWDAGEGIFAAREAAAIGHSGIMTYLAVSPDSKWAASGWDDSNVILSSITQGGRSVGKWTPDVDHQWSTDVDTVWHLAFSPDSQCLACSGNEGRIVIWDVEQRDELGVLLGHTEPVHTVMWSPDGTKLASGSDDMTVRIWDAETYQQIRLLEDHSAMVTFVVFSPNGKLLASGGADCQCLIWEVETGVLKHNLSGHYGVVWAATFDPYSSRIVTGSDDGSVRIWSVDTGEQLLHREHEGPVWAVAFSDGGKQVVSASSETVQGFNSYTGESGFILKEGDCRVNSMQVSPDGTYVASALSDHSVRLLDSRDGSCALALNEHLNHVLFSPDGRTLLLDSNDGTAHILPTRVLSELFEPSPV